MNSWDRSVLAQAYGLSPRQVARDGRVVQAWRGPLDDLLAQLRATYDWPAATAYKYLRSVRTVLAGLQPS